MACGCKSNDIVNDKTRWADCGLGMSKTHDDEDIGGQEGRNHDAYDGWNSRVTQAKSVSRVPEEECHQIQHLSSLTSKECSLTLHDES
jgi:hypothetical protein